MLEAFAWGFLGASSLILGAFMVAVHTPSSWTLGLVMGFGSGVLLSVVSFELIEEAANTSSDNQAPVALGFAAGAIVFYLGDRLLERMGSPAPASGGDGGGDNVRIVLGTVLDGVPESAVLGLTLLQTGSIGVSMLIAVFVSNLPESIAASDNLATSGWSRRNIYLLWTGVTLVSAVASALGYQLLDGASSGAIAFVLAFVGGAILCMLTTTMVPEAYQRAGLPTGLMATLGFAVAFFINWFDS